jgi:hypothetical protein
VKLDAATIGKARDEARERIGRLASALPGLPSDKAEAVQRELDRETGRHAALEAVFDTHFRFPVALGTVMHGIDVSKLDWQTRAMVMSRNLGTIYALGGRPDPE